MDGGVRLEPGIGSAELGAGLDAPDPSVSGIALSGGDATLVFRRCTDAALRARVFALREQVWRGTNDYLLGTRAGLHAAEDEFDRDAYLFCCTRGEDVVAACRFGPRSGGRFEASLQCEIPAAVLERPETLLQINRVVVRGDLRGRRITEVMMHLSCRWLVERSAYRSFFALCVPKLAQFYQHFGAEIVPGQEVCLPQRNDQLYRFIRGDLERSADAIRRYLGSSACADGRGWNLPVQAGVDSRAPA